MRTSILLIFLLASFISWAQQEAPPEGIVFQAVALDEEGQEIVGIDAKGLPIKSREISVRFSILEERPDGSEEYVEVHSTNTDAYGLFTLIIGEGTAQLGQFNEIDWGAGFKFLKVEIDIEGGTNYSLSSIQQMFSVPYALYSKESETSGFALRSDTAQYAFNAQIADSVRHGGGSQTLSISRDSIFISGGNGVKLPAQISLDNDSTNEIQLLIRARDSVSITNGNTVDIRDQDHDTLNEIQTISLLNDTIRLSKGGGSIPLSNIADSIIKNGGVQINQGTSGNGNDLCLTGIFVNLETWADSLGIIQIQPHGLIYDSAMFFNAFDNVGSHTGAYIHDRKLDTVIKISNLTTFFTYVSDSIVYLAYSDSTILLKINDDLSINKLASFYRGPGSIKDGSGLPFGFQTRPIINSSRDLIWIPNRASGVGMDDVLKFDYGTLNLQTHSNPRKGQSSSFSQFVSGDSIFLDNRLLNSNTMTTLRTFTFLERLSPGYSAFYFNGLLYYHTQSTEQFRVYNLQANKDVYLDNVSDMNFIGVNNGELWFDALFTRTTIERFNFMNFSLHSQIPFTGTITLHGNIRIKGYGNPYSPFTSSNKNIVRDNTHHLMGHVFTHSSSGRLRSFCINGTYPLSLGYFYSE